MLDDRFRFDDAVEAHRQAPNPYVKGDPRPVTEFFSRRDDITLVNPLDPPRRGPAEVDQAIAEAAATLKEAQCRLASAVSVLGRASRRSPPLRPPARAGGVVG